jgi:hypothetical protein
MPDAKPIALSESNWSEIADALGIAGNNNLRIKPFEPPVSDGFFTAAVASVPSEWQRLVIVVFPYGDLAWQRLASTVLQFEARRWERWCMLQEHLMTEADRACPPMWWSRTAALQPFARNVSITLDDGRNAQIPALVRPYIPYPTLRDNPFPPARVAEGIGELRAISEWIIGEEDIGAFFQRRVSPNTPARPTRWWHRLLWWRRRANGPFIMPRLEYSPSDDILTADQLLSDGHQLIPTRWRVFHGKHSRFGRTS